jgi:hypothetical protein
MCLAPKHENFNLKVEAREAVHSTRSTITHANSYRICVYATQKDCSGCGACRMATVYRPLEPIYGSYEISPRDFIPQKNKPPPGTGVVFSY